MNKLKNYWIILIIVFSLTILNNNNTYINISTVQGTVEPVLESEIVIGIDLSHNNAINSSDITKLTSILNTTFSSQEIVFLRDDLTFENLLGIDVLTILAPTEDFEPETEVTAIEDFIKAGKSVLAATGFRNQTGDPLNDYLNIFGLKFNYTNPITSKVALARNFTSPPTPLVENISQIIIPNGIGISFNESKLESYLSPVIIHYNPILVKSLDEDTSENNTLISSLEFENGARILAVGSVDMFNNSYIEPLDNSSSLFLDNTNFLINAIKWLGRNTGFLNFYRPWVDLDGRSIDIGTIVHGNVTLVNTLNQSLSQVQLIIALERTGSILSSRIMRLAPNNSSRYFGWVSTEGLSYGYCDVIFMAKHVGYLSIELRAGRLYIEPPFPSPEPPNEVLLGLFSASSLLFVSSAVLVYINLGKKE
ncbi:MAG: hypothetical protein ACFFB2_10650 [Promethearchaeota archaeon]